MGRKTIAAKILDDDLGVEFKDNEGPFLICYEFALKKGETIRINFFKNLHRIMRELGDGLRVQKSTIECKHERTARAIRALCKHYGTRDIIIYEIKRMLEE